MLEAPQLGLLLWKLHPVSDLRDLSNLVVEFRWFHFKYGGFLHG